MALCGSASRALDLGDVADWLRGPNLARPKNVVSKLGEQRLNEWPIGKLADERLN
jgi:hypothetical protein